MDDGVLEGLEGSQPSFGRVLGEWPHMLLLAFGWGFAFWLWHRLPESVPIHWNLHMQVDGWGGRGTAAFLFPVAATIAYLLLVSSVPILAWMLTGTPRVLRQVRFILPALPVAMQVGLYGRMGLHPGTCLPPSDSAIWMILALFWVFLGNLMPRLEVRTRYRDAWRAGYRTGGRALVAVGLLQMAFVGLPPVPRLVLFLVTLLPAGILPYVVAQRRINRSRGAVLRPEGSLQPWLHRFDLLALLGEVLVLGLLLPRHANLPLLEVASLGLAAPMAWLALVAETRLRGGGEVQRARAWIRGWLALGLAVQAAAMIIASRLGVASLLVALGGGVLALALTGLGQWTARRAAPAVRRGDWGEGPTLWDPSDPRVIVPKLMGWSCNFAHLASWILLACLLVPLLILIPKR